MSSMVGWFLVRARGVYNVVADLLLGRSSSSSLSSLSEIGAGMFSTRVPSASSYSARLRTSPFML